MKEFELRDMAEALTKAGILDKKNEETAVKILGDYWEGRICLIWSYGDVMDRARGLDMNISEDSAKEIIDSIDSNFDCEDGITWSTIDSYLDEEEYEEESKERTEVRDAGPEDLPLLMNTLKSASAKEMLEERLKNEVPVVRKE